MRWRAGISERGYGDVHAFKQFQVADQQVEQVHLRLRCRRRGLTIGPGAALLGVLHGAAAEQLLEAAVDVSCKGAGPHVVQSLRQLIVLVAVALTGARGPLALIYRPQGVLAVLGQAAQVVVIAGIAGFFRPAQCQLCQDLGGCCGEQICTDLLRVCTVKRLVQRMVAVGARHLALGHGLAGFRGQDVDQCPAGGAGILQGFGVRIGERKIRITDFYGLVFMILIHALCPPRKEV